MSTTKKPAQHIVEHRSHHAAKSGEVADIAPRAPEAVPPPAEPPAPVEVVGVSKKQTLTDYFDCRCGEKRNLSMEMGVYRCIGCGDEHTAQTLENRKAADK
jgi:hypothetical protein